jgi:hypothetical protein
MEKAVLFGPFVGEMYWEAARFAPMLPFYKKNTYKGKNVKFIILTREERFDLYGCYADILIPLRIEGDYQNKQPNCFRLNNYPIENYHKLASKFKNRYSKRFNVIKHIYPDVSKKNFLNKNQYLKQNMIFKYKPRKENYELVESYISDNKPLVILAPRFRKGFKRNWGNWLAFYDRLAADKFLNDNFRFIICGKPGEYVPDEKKRFYDMNDITVGKSSSLIGLLLVVMEKSVFTFGSQSAIPNISLLYGVEVLEFGCQKQLHTKTYNIRNTPITFIENKQYDISVDKIFPEFKKLLKKKEKR